MHWILQENLFREREWARLIGALDRFELPYSVHKVIPFVGELVPPPAALDGKVICFGSYSLRHAARRFGWHPGVYDLEDADFEVQRLAVAVAVPPDVADHGVDAGGERRVHRDQGQPGRPRSLCTSCASVKPRRCRWFRATAL